MQSPNSHESLLQTALADGAALLGIKTPSRDHTATDMQTVLKNRLQAYHARRFPGDSSQDIIGLSALEDLQLLTAKEALSVLQRVQNILDYELQDGQEQGESSGPGRLPSIGTRDLSQLRTMLSICFRWAVNPLFIRVSAALPNKIPSRSNGPTIIDLTSDSQDFQQLSRFILSMLTLVFPEGVEGRISQTLITTSILSHHLSDLLFPSITLGWLPESMTSSSMHILHQARPLVLRLLKLVTPAQAIISLGGILSSTTPLPSLHTRKTCIFFLNKQLLRPEGVRGLCEAVFSEEESENGEVKLEKLEQVAATLNTVPVNMKPNEYYSSIFLKVFKILTTDERVSFKRAAAFTIYRAVIPKYVQTQPSNASDFVLHILHDPFLHVTSYDKPLERKSTMQPHEALSSLIVLLANAEPSPGFISKLLTPIFSELYLLSYDLDQVQTADPNLKQSITNLLVSWGKIVDQAEGSKTLWDIIDAGKKSHWRFNLEGHFWKSSTPEDQHDPAILLPGDRKKMQETLDTLDVDVNVFNLYPDPGHFVRLLTQIDRGDISSSLFVELLENYRERKRHPKEDSLVTLLRLQIIMQMQSRLSGGTTSNILRNSGQLLSFILHVLESSKIRVGQEERMSQISHKNLLIPDDNGNGHDIFDDVDSDNVDSDDEASDSEIIGPDDELIETAITLLLSVLEVDDKVTVQTYPIVNNIFTKLEPLVLYGSSSLRPLAREARLVITARIAEEPRKNEGTDKGKEDVREIYQRALKLLQDPILPVRAHGLLLLRQLVGEEYKRSPQLSNSLLPSILSIFLQSVQDEDSYIYLNAVQGLAALVDVHGKEILQGLVRDYAQGLSGLGAGNLVQQDVDVRTRIGEALSTVIKRVGSALPLYIDILVPPLFATVRRPEVPTTLRVSSLSLLGDCIDTYILAVLPYVEDLSQMIIDLLQVESRPLQVRRESQDHTIDGNSPAEDEDCKAAKTAPTMDSDPTSKDPKFPPLRRSALHFLSLLIRSSTKLTYEEGKTRSITRETYRRMRLTLEYVAATDEDDIVRVMAKETKENLEGLLKAELGL